MEDRFVPECFFDTVLVTTILRVKQVNHQKGCPNVVKLIRTGKLKDDFAVGIIDKDKKELDYLKEECTEVLKLNNLVLLKHRSSHHYFIQLAPAIESWILKVAEEGAIDIETYGLPNNLYELRRFTKTRIAEDDENLRNLCKKLLDSESETMKTLVKWLKYLLENNRNTDLNKLVEYV